jgi:hypothetical protein
MTVPVDQSCFSARQHFTVAESFEVTGKSALQRIHALIDLRKIQNPWQPGQQSATAGNSNAV